MELHRGGGRVFGLIMHGIERLMAGMAGRSGRAYSLHLLARWAWGRMCWSMLRLLMKRFADPLETSRDSVTANQEPSWRLSSETQDARRCVGKMR